MIVPPLPSGALDEAVDRTNTNSRKMKGKGKAYEGCVPLWIADMDFRSPQPIVDALVARASNGVYGYTDCPPELETLVCDRLKTVYGSTITPDPKWFRWLPGLIPGLNHAVRAACAGANDAVAIPTPVYAPFLDAPSNHGKSLLTVPLEQLTSEGQSSEGLYFTVDWAALEAALASKNTKLLHWCNPHNPTGRVWTRRELVRVARLCVEHDVRLCSDEVWGELPLEPDAHAFCSMLSLLPADDKAGSAAEDDDLSDPEATAGIAGLKERLIILTSPSKCFNVAPLDIALAVIPNEELRGRFVALGADAAEVTCFGYSAACAAYGDPESEAWRQRLVTYLAANRDYAAERLGAMGIRCTRPEASYLMWMDCSNVLPEGSNAQEFFLKEAKVAFTGGVAFGGGARTCRLNFGCKRETLEEGLNRMAAAIAALDV